MVQVHQIFPGGVDLDPEEFFTVTASDRTRGHPWKLNKPRAESRPRRQAFSARVVNDWNGLPLSVVSAGSVDQFKSELDAHWANIWYLVPDWR